MDIRENKPWQKNNVKNEKPNVNKTFQTLTGYLANSLNAGHNKTIAYFPVMAGTKIREIKLPSNWQLLTPLTPAYQNLYITFRTYFVPNSRVWVNAEKFTAQLNNGTGDSPTEEPSIGGYKIPELIDVDGENRNLLSNTIMWRDSFISSYIPRIGIYESQPISSGGSFYDTMPAHTALPLRGRVAIYNDFERDKQFDEKRIEYNNDTVTQAEWDSYLPSKNKGEIDYYYMRAKAPDSYYTNYRTSVQGFQTKEPRDDDYQFTEQNYGIEYTDSTNLISWANWESYIAEARSQAENSMGDNPWDVIAKIRGSKKLTEGKTQLISVKTLPLNYSAITQNSYNNNQQIKEDFRVLGKQGAYSFTNINEPIAAGFIANEEGYIHIIATVSADTVYESGFDRTNLNIKWDEKYRPDLKDKKFDVLYEIETGTYKDEREGINEKNIIGFKRAYTEYFKLVNVIGGDMTSKPYYTYSERPTGNNEIGYYFTDIIEPNDTYQFFETDRNYFQDYKAGIVVRKKPWKDYSDLMVNKNQAIKNEIVTVTDDETDEQLATFIGGQNQIFFAGIILADVDLPIDEEIKNNYTQWGEH